MADIGRSDRHLDTVTEETMDIQVGRDIPQTITESIEHVVQLRTGGMVRNLRVEVFEESVVISGRASTYYTKQLATHAAFDAIRNDKMNLTNDIEVS